MSDTKDEETIIGIVANSGSRELLWHGVLTHDEIAGYKGRLLSYEFKVPRGPTFFELDPVLDKSLVHCILDGRAFGTIIWPRYGAQSTNFSSRSVDIRIANLVRGAHFDEDDASIEEITFQSPILLSLFREHPVTGDVSTTPYAVTVKTNYREITAFSSALGRWSLRSSGGYAPSHRGVEIKANGFLDLKLNQKITLIDALRITTRLEGLISLFASHYVRFEQVLLTAEANEVSEGVQSAQGALAKSFTIQVSLDRPRYYKDTKIDLAFHEMPVWFEQGRDLGPVIDRFFAIYEKIEGCLNWFRIITAEERYLEDKFFYSVRMIESAYRNLGLEIERDETALFALQTLVARVRDDVSLTNFLAQRVQPIFAQPVSLASIVNDLMDRYNSVTLTRILDSRRVRSLRAKEAHGSFTRYTAGDYAYMQVLYPLLTALLPCLVLEYCGVERTELLSKLAKAHRMNRFFDERFTTDVEKGLAEPDQITS